MPTKTPKLIYRVFILSNRRITGPAFATLGDAESYIKALKKQVYGAPGEDYEIRTEPA